MTAPCSSTPRIRSVVVLVPVEEVPRRGTATAEASLAWCWWEGFIWALAVTVGIRNESRVYRVAGLLPLEGMSPATIDILGRLRASFLRLLQAENKMDTMDSSNSPPMTPPTIDPINTELLEPDPLLSEVSVGVELALENEAEDDCDALLDVGVAGLLVDACEDEVGGDEVYVREVGVVEDCTEVRVVLPLVEELSTS